MHPRVLERDGGEGGEAREQFDIRVVERPLPERRTETEYPDDAACPC
jgi:hypothetical protein